MHGPMQRPADPTHITTIYNYAGLLKNAKHDWDGAGMDAMLLFMDAMLLFMDAMLTLMDV
eukprot:2718407-Rhodomonas_salina.1